MVKSLTVSIESVEKGEHISITGTQNPTEFVKDVVLTIGSFKISVNSQDLAEALAAIVDFQTVPKQFIQVESGIDIQNLVEMHEPKMTGISNLGWTK
jgi:hypothetical protein